MMHIPPWQAHSKSIEFYGSKKTYRRQTSLPKINIMCLFKAVLLNGVDLVIQEISKWFIPIVWIETNLTTFSAFGSQRKVFPGPLFQKVRPGCKENWTSIKKKRNSQGHSFKLSESQIHQLPAFQTDKTGILANSQVVRYLALSHCQAMTLEDSQNWVRLWRIRLWVGD